MDRYIVGVSILAMAFGLSGCDSLRKAMGEKKQAPDEFVVYKRPPLILPPEFGLRPPKPGAARPSQSLPRDEAKQAVLSIAGIGALPRQKIDMGTSPGLNAFLARTGAYAADPKIRSKVEEETSVFATEDREFIDKLIFWVDDAPYPGTVVDPRKEQRRIMQNEALGKPITEGKVPEIKRKTRRKGLLNF